MIKIQLMLAYNSECTVLRLVHSRKNRHFGRKMLARISFVLILIGFMMKEVNSIFLSRLDLH